MAKESVDGEIAPAVGVGVIIIIIVRISLEHQLKTSSIINQILAKEKLSSTV